MSHRRGMPRMRSLDEQVLIAPPMRPDKPSADSRTCARQGCGTTFAPLMTGSGPKRYCSARCRIADGSDRQRARRKTLREFGPVGGERYYVNEIHGFEIGEASSGGRAEVPVCCSVVDDAYGVEVARFQTGHGHPAVRIRAKAKALCAAKNADERDWELGLGKYAA